MQKRALCLLCISLLLMLSACGQKEEVSVQAPEVLPIEQEEQEETALIVLYAYDDIEDDTYSVVTEIEQASFGVEAIVEAYQTSIIQGIYGQKILINDIKTVAPSSETAQDGKVYIDLDGASIQQLNLDDNSKDQFFANLSRSIDENLGYIDKIYYTMDGKNF